MQHGVAANRLFTMSTERSEKAMEPDELRRLMASSGRTTMLLAAETLGVHRMTVSRWLSGKIVINAAAAALIRERLAETKPKKKK